MLGACRQQIPAIRAAKGVCLGVCLKVVAVDPQPDAIGFGIADEVYVFDLADVGGCLNVAQKCGVVGVLTLAYDYPLPMVARNCEEFGLPGLLT